MPLLAARFVERPHRFAVRAVLDDGRNVEAHLADPGRLRDLLLPNAELRLRPVPVEIERKTRFTAVLVRASQGGVWVSLETARANTLADGALAAGTIPGLRDWRRQREVREGGSRFDFLLERADRRCWVEVKSVTWVDGEIGRFPDAPTARGRRHLRELTRLVAGGDEALLLFVVQRADAGAVQPAETIDPAFAAALVSARQAGVRLEAVVFGFDACGEARFVRRAAVETAADALP